MDWKTNWRQTIALASGLESPSYCSSLRRYSGGLAAKTAACCVIHCLEKLNIELIDSDSNSADVE